MKKLLILTFLLIFIAGSKDNTGISNNLPTPKNQINIKENGLKSVYSKIEKTIDTFEYETAQGIFKGTDEKTFYPSGNLNSNKITEYNITIDDSKPSLII